jgi:hypothetical protein
MREGPVWLRKLLGDDFFNTVAYGVLNSDTEAQWLKGLPQLRSLSLNSTQVTDKGLEYLRGLTDLQVLWLDGTQVTNEGVKKLRQALLKCTIYR